ncbi:MAG TPA: DUF302 domain-containing protein [Gaiellaceae bacterium]|nr:DUF302 domain-containing protein [Gaiellaceae bacterium]
MAQTDSTYAVSRTTTLDFDAAVAAARTALAAEGFGVLCEIDVQATLREKIGAEREPYVILGACNPPLAHRALEMDAEIGVLLPCNVVVYVEDGTTHVAAIDAAVMLGVVGSAELEPVAAEVSARLARVVEAID